MADIGKLTLMVDHESLRKVVSQGRLLEFANALATEASAQISSQLVEKLANAAVLGGKLEAGVSIDASFIFDGGDFGTRPPRPHWGVGPVVQPNMIGSLLQRVAGTPEKIG